MSMHSCGQRVQTGTTRRCAKDSYREAIQLSQQQPQEGELEGLTLRLTVRPHTQGGLSSVQIMTTSSTSKSECPLMRFHVSLVQPYQCKYDHSLPHHGSSSCISASSSHTYINTHVYTQGRPQTHTHTSIQAHIQKQPKPGILGHLCLIRCNEINCKDVQNNTISHHKWLNSEHYPCL